ncbi:VanW family protein [Jeotgalibacillus sp. JSM ZJ347]|uniref:VanW family protein n=1 Tax=Jeotgalibacillus sp. JSM ZJ347 TaxID=3342117 RepID=UPI0035A8C35A
MNQNIALKMLGVMLLSFIIIAGAAVTGPALLPDVTAGEEIFSEGTMIGRTNVAGLSFEEAEAAVTEDILNWQQQSELIVTYGEEKSELDPELIEFFPREAVQTANDGAVNPVPLNVNMGDAVMILNRDFGLPESEVLDPAKVQSEIERRITFLQTGEEDPIELSVLLASGTGETLIAEAAGNFTVTAAQQNYIFTHESVTLAPGEYYSVLNLSNQVIESVEDYEITDEELSKIASVIHTAVLETPLAIAERHISLMLPDYAVPGKEASIAIAGNNDYKVMNATQSPFTINLESIQGALYVRITGPVQPFTYTAEIPETDILPFRTVRQYSAFVADGAVEVTEPGLDGQLIPIERVTLDVDSIEIDREFLYEDFYPPVHRVEVTSLDSPAPLAEENPEEQDDSENTDNPSDAEDENNQTDGENNESPATGNAGENSGANDSDENSSGQNNAGGGSAGSGSDQNNGENEHGRKENDQNKSIKQDQNPK